jgi:hypothetical protein
VQGLRIREGRYDVGGSQGILHDGIAVQVMNLATTLGGVTERAQAMLILQAFGFVRGLPNINARLVSLILLIGMGGVKSKRPDEERCCNDPESFFSHTGGFHLKLLRTFYTVVELEKRVDALLNSKSRKF